ncbi:MAG TPA: hypothetical protein VK726_25540 [Acetobacteraceae bacterium]|jgi:hypothetical protein|nr:hypothetical protein [Acetobacteraceae bacterium]
MLKGLAVTPQFLREEAARFRGMAETVEREGSKERLLRMAADYESRAMSADKLTEPSPSEPIPVKSGKRTAKTPSEAI